MQKISIPQSKKKLSLRLYFKQLQSLTLVQKRKHMYGIALKCMNCITCMFIFPIKRLNWFANDY